LIKVDAPNPIILTHLPMLPKLASCLLILPLLFLSSCVEGEEELWINADASGKIKAHYSIPSVAMKDLGNPEDYLRSIEIIDEQEKGLTVERAHFTKTKSRITFQIEATFQNASELLEIADRSQKILIQEARSSPEQIEALLGQIDLRIASLNPTFSREIHLKELLPKMVQKNPKMLGKSTFRYTINLPVAIRHSNAHALTNERRTATWTFLLKDYTQTPMAMFLQTQLPLPWWIFTLLLIVALLTIWLIWKIYKRFTKSPENIHPIV